MWKTEIVRLSAEDALTTAAYLTGLAQRAQDISAGVQALFGRCCLSSLAGGAIDMGELADEATQLGERIVRHPDAQSLSLDPLLLIEIHRTMAEAGKKIAVLHELHNRIASELAQQPSEARQMGRVRLITARLAGLGYPAQYTKPGKDAASLLGSPERWFTASVSELADLADHMMADGRELEEIPSRVLSLIALAELRNYRVDLGCTLLRVVFEMGEPCAEAKDALNFIALQRRRDGRYGFTNHILESAEGGKDPHLSIYLPLTVNALWLFRTEAERNRQLEAAAVA